MSTEVHEFRPEEVMAYLDGEVTDSRALALADHLEDCTTCSSLADDFRALSQQLIAWTFEPAALLEPSSHVDPEIQAQPDPQMVCAEFPDGLPVSYKQPRKSYQAHWLVSRRLVWALAGIGALAVILSVQSFRMSRAALSRSTSTQQLFFEEAVKALAEYQKLDQASSQRITGLDTSVHTELATKASSDDVKTVDTKVVGVRTDVGTTREDLKMAKSEMGTLIARNHNEVNQLRHLGERDYTEFTINGRNRPQNIANVIIELESVSEKRDRFNLAVTVEGRTFPKKNRTVNDPIFFYTTGNHIPEEIVVNKIGKDTISGYVSVSKMVEGSASGHISSAVGKMIERTASLSLIVKEVEAARAALEEIAKRHEGYFAELNTSGQSNAARTLTASMRVPASDLDSTLAELRKLGQLDEEKQGGEEVSQQYVDLKARLENSRHTEKRLTELLAKRADKLKDVLDVERELASTREEIERMDSEQRGMRQQVDYASIELNLREEYKPALNLGPPSAGTRMRNALVDGYHAVVENALGLVVLLLKGGPSILFWMTLVFFPLRWTWRKFRPIITQKQPLAGTV